MSTSGLLSMLKNSVNYISSTTVIILVTFILLALTTYPILLPTEAQVGVSIVQSSNASCNPCSSSLSFSFSNIVTQGDVVVVGVDASGIMVSGVSDSLGTSYTQTISAQVAGNDAYIYDGTVGSSGTDSITVSFSGTPSIADLYVYELAGATTSGLTASGSGNGTFVSTSASVSFQSDMFLVGIIGTNSSVTQGTSFTSVAGSYGAAQSMVSGVSSTTDFPATLGSSAIWVEAAVVLDPLYTTTLTSSVTSTLTSTVTSTETATSTTTSTVTSTSISTSTTTSISSITVTQTSVPPPSSTTMTVTSTKTLNNTITDSSIALTPASLVVYAFGSGGNPISGGHIALTNSSGYSVTANTNSSGMISFSDLTPGTKYVVAATIEGASLSAPVTIAESGGASIVVLEPSPQIVTTTAHLSSTSNQGSAGNGSNFGIEALAVDCAAGVIILVTVITLVRKRSKVASP